MAKTEKKFTRILSIDGGGIRGIIPGQILVALEDKLRKVSSDDNARIADYFDLIAGTSTGGILTCAYLCPDQDKPHRPRFSAREVVDLYLKRGGDIFSIPLRHRLRAMRGLLDEKYPSESLEKALQDYFGDTRLSQLLKPCLITSYDITKRRGHFFTQHDAIKRKGWNYYVKDIARATSAAPTYFECSNLKSLTGVSYPLIDGGVFVNNPALCAFAEVYHEFNITAKDMVLLSLGTGYEKQSYKYDQAKDWGLIGWVRPLLSIMMSGVSEVVDYQLRQIYSAVKAPKQYLRINTELPVNVSQDLDEASGENLNALKELGIETAQEFDIQLNAFVKLLIQS